MTRDSCAAFVEAGWSRDKANAVCGSDVDDGLLQLSLEEPWNATSLEPIPIAAVKLAACQLDAVLRPQDPGSWGLACDEFLVEDPEATAAALDADDAVAKLRFGFDDHRRRATAAPLLDQIDAALEAADDVDANAPIALDVYFTNDSTLAPMLALLDLFDPAAPGAAGLIPFASRLLFERTQCGEVALSYNDATLFTFPDLRAWRAALPPAP